MSKITDKIIHLEDLKPGMIGLAGGDSFIQKGIKYFTNSEWSHSFTIMQHPEMYPDTLCCMETTATYVHCITMEDKLEEPDYMAVWRPIDHLPSMVTPANEFIYNRYNGMLYGYESYFWFIYRWVMRKIFKKEPTKMWKWCSSRVTCTELTCAGLSRLGMNFLKLFPNDLNTYAPEELFAIMEREDSPFEFVGWLHKH